MIVSFDGPATGSDNMRQDLDLLALAERSRTWHMRTYTWSPWCVSLGKHQPLDAVDANRLHANGFDVVHRPTGGRAVLHANELTYCVAVPLSQGLTAQDIYAAVHTLIVAALRSIGIPELEYQEVPTDLRLHYASSGVAGASCFTSSARSEIMARGRKVVGSAQRVMQEMVLQHGSILCGPGHEKLAEVLRADESARSVLRERLQDGAIHLSDLAGKSITPEECAEAIERIAARIDPLASAPGSTLADL
jgi:lipoate-protein ligase A